MKRNLLLFYFVCCVVRSALSQGGTWTWIGGANQTGSSGVFGTQGVPSAGNHPPGLYEPAEWKDKQGNFWLYGGWTPDAFSDLWKYNPVTAEWTWVKGNGLLNQSAVYGTKGVANIANTPGERSYAAASWVDTSGALWLFGGSNRNGYQNDLWRYDIGTNEWTWVKGNNVGNAAGVHGAQGVPAAANLPGTRAETCSAWTDSVNDLWLFGGLGFDDAGKNGFLDDLWKYDIGTNEWTWMKGSAFAAVNENYGVKGVANVTNDPGGRATYTKWKDMKNNFWLMGGLDLNYESLNDVWKYDLAVNEWTWMSGTNVADDGGNYQASCSFDSISMPYARMEQRSAVTDNCGRFWLFGGEDYEENYFFGDLWVFDSPVLKWNRVSGNNVPNLGGSYGGINVTSPSNYPPARFGAVSWWGNNNKFYLFGGAQTYCYSDLWVFTPDTNCVPLCGSAAFPPPVAAFKTVKTTICANDCINFTDLSSNAASWQWSFAGGLPPTSTSENPQNICYTDSGIYSVTLIASNASGSDTVTFSNYINVMPSPPTPSIVQHHDTLSFNTDPSYVSYQWYQDSTLIKGATDSLFVFVSAGNYNVKVTNSYGCSVADGVNVVGIEEFTVYGLRFTVCPNPVQNELIIAGDLKFEIGNLKLTISNVLGKEIYSEQPEIRNSKLETTIDVSTLAQGIYFVELASSQGRWIGRFVKE